MRIAFAALYLFLAFLAGRATAQQLINLGSGPNTGTGDTALTAFGKVNANFNTLGPVFTLPNNTFLCNFSGGGPAKACNNLVLSPTIAWAGDGVTAGNSTIFDGSTFTGTCTGHCYAHFFNTTWQVSNAGVAAQNLDVTTFLNSANFTGGFIGLNSAVNVSAASGNSSVSKIYQAGQLTASTTVDDNGSPGTPMNSLFGLGVTCQIQTPSSGNSYWKGCGGIENDLSLQTNTSASTISGISVVLLSSNAVAATNQNDGFFVGAQVGATPTITTAYGIGSYLGTNPLASSASIMRFNPTNGAGAGPTTGYGIDFAGHNSGAGAITFTGEAYNSTGFSVSGTGLLTSTGATISGAATAINKNSNFATEIGDGSTTSNVTVGNPNNLVNVGGPIVIGTGGAVSAPSWTTSGIGLSGAAQTYTDTTASGTITREAVYALPASTVAATSAGVTVTHLDTLYLPAPIAGTNVTATNLRSLETAGAILSGGLIIANLGVTATGATTSVNVNSNNATNINTGSSNGTVSIANGTGNNAVSIGNGTGKVTVQGPLISAAGTRFSVASGTGACATSSTLVGGVQAGDLTCTAATAASTVTLTLVATTTAYACWGRDITTPTTVTQTGAKSTTSVTLTLTSVTQNDVIQFGCLGY